MHSKDAIQMMEKTVTIQDQAVDQLVKKAAHMIERDSTVEEMRSMGFVPNTELPPEDLDQYLDEGGHLCDIGPFENEICTICGGKEVKSWG